MRLQDAQGDLSKSFVGGGPGVFVSGVIWIAAGLVERSRGTASAFVLLFFAGMLIFPLATLIARLLFRREKPAAENPLGLLALESTVGMIGGLFAAWLMLPMKPALVFPLAAVAVGTHYAVFRTVYGDRLFWLLGGLVAGIGLLAVFPVVRVPAGTALAVGVVEILFAALLTARALRGAVSPSDPARSARR